MKIQIFIFCWNKYVQKAKEMENELKKFGNVIVINSNTTEKNENWINLNNAYFAEQWNTLIKNIDPESDYIFHIQSDATIPDYNKLIQNFKKTVSKYNVGIYSPNIDYTWYKYDIEKLTKIDDNLYEVSNTDCTCWFIKKELIDNKNLFNINTNYIGYGADWYYTAKSTLNKLLVLRDYNITVLHPIIKGYNNEEGNKLFNVWLIEQKPEIITEIKNLMNVFYKTNINHNP